jgi:23S rRNA (uracil1939-C5)-methyltransferase
VGKLLYISCNPATLARDVKQLAPMYALEGATPFDMFAQTAEVEVLAELRRVA